MKNPQAEYDLVSGWRSQSVFWRKMWNVKKLFRTENQPDAEPPVRLGIRLMGSILLWIERPHTARDTLLLPIPPSLPCKQDFQRAKEGGGGRGWWMGGLMDRPDTGLSLLRINCFTPPPPPWKDFKAAKTRFKVAPHCQRMELKIGDLTKSEAGNF